MREHIKEKIIGWLDVYNYEDDFKEVQSKYNRLGRDYESLKRCYEEVKRELAKATEHPEQYWADELEKAKREYEKNLDEMETYHETEKSINESYIELIKAERDYLQEECDKWMRDATAAEHRGIAIGRRSAYSEMGIRNIDAHQHGNMLVMTEDGEVFELLKSLEDVKSEAPEEILGFIDDDGIEIGDFGDEEGEE